jgi:hypothetical protein
MVGRRWGRSTANCARIVEVKPWLIAGARILCTSFPIRPLELINVLVTAGLAFCPCGVETSRAPIMVMRKPHDSNARAQPRSRTPPPLDDTAGQLSLTAADEAIVLR